MFRLSFRDHAGQEVCLHWKPGVPLGRRPERHNDRELSSADGRLLSRRRLSRVLRELSFMGAEEGGGGGC